MTDFKDITLKPKLHPPLAVLPPHLKDPANYDKIQKTIVQSFAGKHSHGEVIEWAQCADCQRRFSNRRHVLKTLGFKNPAQYMLWKKIHTEIKSRFPLVDWKKKK